MEFNINNYVRVRLTDAGRAHHRKEWEELLAGTKLTYTPPVEDAGGWSRWQLWNLMQVFGPMIGMGMPSPFGTVIDILVED